MTEWVLGVDAGGTRTKVAVADSDGRIVARGEAGPGNLLQVHEVGLRDAVAAALQRSSASSGSAASWSLPLKTGFAGVAGAGTAEGCERVRRALAPFVRTIEVDHDLRVAQAGALDLQPGLVIVAGTGSACYGRDDEGRSAWSGGAGPLCGDEGSAYDVGRAALRAVMRAADGRGPSTSLSGRLLKAAQVTEPRELPRRYGAEDRSVVAALAPLICAEAATDEVAQSILDDAARELAVAAVAVSERLGLNAPHVSWSGSFAEALQARVGKALHRALPTAHWVAPAGSPLEGAVRLAVS